MGKPNYLYLLFIFSSYCFFSMIIEVELELGRECGPSFLGWACESTQKPYYLSKKKKKHKPYFSIWSSKTVYPNSPSIYYFLSIHLSDYLVGFYFVILFVLGYNTLIPLFLGAVSSNLLYPFR